MALSNQWKKSTRSGAYSDMCVEVCQDGDTVQTRNSKNTDAGTVTSTAGEWAAFIEGAKAGEFNIL